MADFDVNELLSNPLLNIGVGLLGSTNQPNANIGQIIGQGLENSQQAQLGPLTAKLKKLQLEQAQRAMNFNPADYLQTTPNPEGTNSSLRAAVPALAGQQPAALGGIAGGTMPAADPTQIALNPAAGQPAGLDIQGLLSGGLQAGMEPAQISQIASILDPSMAARAKLQEPYTLGPGQQRVVNGQVVASNDLSPPGGLDSQLRNLTTLRDKAAAAGDTANASLYQTAIDKVSGKFDQDFKTTQLGDLNAQRDANNQFRKTQQDQAQAQRDQQNQFKVQGQAQQLASSIEKSGIPQAQSALDTIQSIMDKYPDGKLPGYGRVEGLLPDWATSQDAQQLRQAVASLANVQLKQRSGAAVTDQEMRRFKQELGTGTAVPEDRVRQGIKQMRNLIESVKRNYAAGASQEAIESYEGSGGMNLSYLRESKGPSATPAVSIDKATPDDIAAAIARKTGKK